MPNVLEAIKLSADYLQKYNIESPRLNAELLLAEILNCKRFDLYLTYDKPLSNDEIIKYREFLKRRSNREPLQYIVGHLEFYGYKYFVNPSVLIPRPETELLVESVLKCYTVNDEIRIMDIGVGSGNISISLLKNLPCSSVVGIDVSDEALPVAYKNAVENHVSDKLELIKFDILQDDYKTLGKFDLIISNPPYISQEDFNNLEPELKVYEPAISLTDYANGYSFYKRIIDISEGLLNPQGKLFFEIGKGQHEIVKGMMLQNGFKGITVVKDYSQTDRIIYGEI